MLTGVPVGDVSVEEMFEVPQVKQVKESTTDAAPATAVEDASTAELLEGLDLGDDEANAALEALKAASSDKKEEEEEESVDPEQVAMVQGITGYLVQDLTVQKLLLYHPARDNLEAIVNAILDGVDEAHWQSRRKNSALLTPHDDEVANMEYKIEVR